MGTLVGPSHGALITQDDGRRVFVPYRSIIYAEEVMQPPFGSGKVKTRIYLLEGQDVSYNGSLDQLLSKED